MADRFDLPASEMSWDEERGKMVRVQSVPPLSPEALALEKDNIKLWFRKFLEGHAKDTGPGGMCCGAYIRIIPLNGVLLLPKGWWLADTLPTIAPFT